MNTLRQVNRLATTIIRFVVGILLLVTFYQILISVLIKPEWDIVISLLLITFLFACYSLGFGQQLEKWFYFRDNENTID
ncbi:MAG: hypothetical protein ACI9IA_002286 [Enterobacterales bacterium]|jgi:hypothetical protein